MWPSSGWFTFTAALATWYLIKLVIGVRPAAADEISGLDVAEIGMEAYPDATEIEEKLRPRPRPPGYSTGVGMPIYK